MRSHSSYEYPLSVMASTHGLFGCSLKDHSSRPGNVRPQRKLPMVRTTRIYDLQRASNVVCAGLRILLPCRVLWQSSSIGQSDRRLDSQVMDETPAIQDMQSAVAILGLPPSTQLIRLGHT
ncbi:uncharacterized protein SCHCODRAFT_02637992 [Schizophyllum commune H4-8]|uniref:uncharacterized protein n=1 Tax=Schizophyllum commune (strain H4-8 / FGSC 9210) TaxID=578458 RepID=UPI00215F5B3F|nr:uncharacterized protein SCHCODRAFT_02637992 [Schizophyllum commune H4-8]KAI5888877.1 hypothetical protein SCHCODRAFT_02637992 [Schizophyllum commune H4-8]